MFEKDLLRGKVALVTGASGGLGRHFAAVLARHGASVVLAARRREALEEAAKELRAAGASVGLVGLDVRDPEGIPESVAAAEAAFGTISILVNNSGVAVTKPLLEQSEEDWSSVVDTNLGGSFRVAQAVARQMVEAGRGGSIVNIASIVGLRAAGQLAPYAASKAGLVHLTRSMAVELARHGIRVNAIAPGYFETDMNRAFFATDAGQSMLKRVPLRRLGRLAELDAPLLFLASDASSFVTGSVVTVDGGHSVNPL